MGLLDGIKRFIDNPEIDADQTADDTVKAIMTLKQKPSVSGDLLLLKLLDEYGNLQQINVGLGNYQKQELLSRFNIDTPNEEIILYICGKLGLFGKVEPQFLVTNTAVYFKGSDSSSSKKYSFIELTKYILLSSEDDGNIRLVNEKEDNIIYAKGMLKKYLSQNSDVFAITKVMLTIQTEMAEINRSAKKNRNDLFKWLNEKIEENLRLKGLYIFDEKLIKSLRTAKFLETSCNLLLLKGYLYKQDHASLLNTLLAMRSTPENEQDILNRYEEIILRYVDELKDFSMDFSDECLTDSFLSENDTSFDYQMASLVQSDTGSDLQKNMLDIYKKYNEDIDYYNTIRKDVQIPIEFILWSCDTRGVSQQKKVEYITSCLFQRNRGMVAVFDKIRSGGLPEKGQLDWCDGQGLTALHYAMISNNTDAIEFCLKHMSFKESLLDDANDELINVRFYGVVALLTGMDNYFEPLMDKTEELAPLLKTKNALSKQKNTLTAIYKTTNMMVSAAKKQLTYTIKEGQASQEQIEQQRYNIDKTLIHLETIQENIRELAKQIEATDDDIYSVKLLLKKRCEEIAGYAKNVSVSFGRYFYFLYSDTGLLEKILDGTLDDLKLYECNGKFIFIDSSIGTFKFENKYSADQNNENAYENDDDGFQKPYVDSWFSENAHNDLKQLTKEYHKLVFRYHPDNNPEMLAAFLSIQNERAEILDVLEYKK